jgi:hypothetical protein
MTRLGLIAVVCLFLGGLAAPVHGQTELPVVEEAGFAPMREQCQRLLKALDTLKTPLPADVDKELRKLIAAGAADEKESATKLQKLLDARCLVGVSINPESRVKAARGLRAAELILDQPVYVLIKVHNDAGVTAALAVHGPQLRSAGNVGAKQWLEATVVGEPPLSAKLSGGKVDYLLLRLTAREAGKREATLQFDVGQGTQDLGFRAEVPILFTISKPAPPKP